MDELVANHKPISIKKIKLRLPLKFQVVHNELIESFKNEKKMNKIIKINSEKKTFCEAIHKDGEQCDIEAKYILINKDNKQIYNNNNSHIALCWFCGLHLLKSIKT